MYLAAICTHIVLKLYSTPEFPEKNFCDGLEMKRASPLGGIQQAGAPETAAITVTPCFFLRLLLTNG